jgi:hypothetical protein
MRLDNRRPSRRQRARLGERHHYTQAHAQCRQTADHRSKPNDFAEFLSNRVPDAHDAALLSN